MLIVVAGLFLILLYHRHLLIAAWAALIVNFAFAMHEIYYVLRDPIAGETLLHHKISSTDR